MKIFSLRQLRTGAGLGVCVTALLSVCVTSVAAQSVPGSVDPGRLQRDLEKPSSADPISPSPQSAASQPPASLTPQGAEKLTFVLDELLVEGVTVYESAVLTALAKARIGQTISVAELFDIASKMTAMYRNDGYMLSQVIVPPQKIDGGSVTLRAVEGYIDAVKVEGLSDERARAVRGYVDKIVGQRPLRSSSLERYLLLANDLPGMAVRSFIEPAQQNTGAATLTLKAKHKPLDVFSRISNRGTDFVGPYQYEIGGSYNGLMSAGQNLTARVLTTPLDHKELKYANLQFTEQVDNEGTSVVLSVRGLQSEPGASLSTLDHKSRSYGADVGVRFKPLRGREQNLFLAATASFNNAETDALGARLSEDKARTLRLGGEYQHSDRLGGASSVSVGVSRGFSIFGATPEGDVLQTRADAEPDATWFDARISRMQSLAPGVSVQIGIAGQYSLDALSSSREFGVGGLANASAFDSSEINGDHGISGRIELRYSTDLSAVDDAVPGGSGVQMYAFGDGGEVWQEDAGSTGQQKDRIASAGIGMRFNLGDHISGSVEGAQPLLQDVSSKGDRDPRVFFELVGRF